MADKKTNYSLISAIKDANVRQAYKFLCDRLASIEGKAITTDTDVLSRDDDVVDVSSSQMKNLVDGKDSQDAVTVAQLRREMRYLETEFASASASLASALGLAVSTVTVPPALYGETGVPGYMAELAAPPGVGRVLIPIFLYSEIEVTVAFTTNGTWNVNYTNIPEGGIVAGVALITGGASGGGASTGHKTRGAVFSFGGTGIGVTDNSNLGLKLYWTTRPTNAGTSSAHGTWTLIYATVDATASTVGTPF